MITKAERNILKRAIIKELTDKSTGIFDKKEGWQVFTGTNLEMVMQCVFDGLNTHTQKKPDEQGRL